MRNQGNNFQDLYRRLRSILPEYRPISEFNGQSGTYKSVTAEGDVYLVTWVIEEFETARRSERLVMDSKKFMNESEAASNWYRPDEGWV